MLLVLMIACMSVGTLVYARTATREGEIAVRSALGASRARIIGQLFVEALVLASVAAAVGLMAADRALTWAIENFNQASGGAPFWMTPGLKLSTILYAGGLAVVSAAMLSFLPALRVTRARLQSHLANLGSGGATLRFGARLDRRDDRPGGADGHRHPGRHGDREPGDAQAENPRSISKSRVSRRSHRSGPAVRGGDHVGVRGAAGADVRGARAAHRAGARRGRGHVRRPRAGVMWRQTRFGEVESSPGAGPAYDDGFRTSAVGPGFFEAFDRPIVAGRAFHEGDWSPGARTVIVNEAFARAFSRDAGTRIADRRSPPVSRDRRSAARPRRQRRSRWFEIVGIVRDVGLDPDDSGDELPFVFHAASAETVSPLVMSVRVRGNPATLAARLPVIAADVDARLLVRDAQPLDAWIRQRDDGLTMQAGALAAVTLLVLFLSALGIFSLVSVSVSRRTREIGLRAALGANPRHVLAGILSRAMVLMGSGITAGGALLLLSVALGQGPSGRPAEDVALFAGYLGVTSAVMLAACLLACIGPARRALRINPTEALREA